MQSTPPILARPDPRRINSAAEHAKTKATLECFMESTNETMNELGRQAQLTYNVASHHIGLLEGQKSRMKERAISAERSREHRIGCQPSLRPCGPGKVGFGWSMCIAACAAAQLAAAPRAA